MIAANLERLCNAANALRVICEPKPLRLHRIKSGTAMRHGARSDPARRKTR